MNSKIKIKPQYKFEAPVVHAKLRGARKEGVKVEQTDECLDLTQMLAPQHKNCYMVKVNGESMIDKGIYHGDILIVDKAEKPEDGKVVIAALNGELTVKIFRVVEGNVYLYAANKKFLPIKISPYFEFQAMGVVKHVIHEL